MSYTEDLQVLSDSKMDHYVHFSVEERTRIVELYFATKSPTLVQRQFRREHPEKKIPHRHTITRLVEKFRNTGSVINNNKGHCGAKATARTPAKVQDVRDHLEQSSGLAKLEAFNLVGFGLCLKNLNLTRKQL